nr:thioesterase domain-containing protein [Streptomyces sp. NBC_00974]
MTLDELAEVLRHHGGTPDRVLSSREMLAMIRPLLVADFAVSEEYRYTAEPPLDIPLTAFAATGDPRATVAQLAAWEAQSTRAFTLHELTGGHFAVMERASEVHALIAKALDTGIGTRTNVMPT